MAVRVRDMMIGLIAAAVGAAATIAATSASGPAPAVPVAATVPATERAAIEAIVRDYILANPEILPQAMERLQGRETAKAIAANRAAIERPFAGAWEGAKDADVVLVEFFDYACGYCRASLPDIDRLLRDDPRLKIVYRELPVLGPDSVEAARLGLAAASGTRYAAVHRALYAGGRPDAATRARVAAQFGLPTGASAAVTRELESNQALQNSLRLTGTPTWIVGDRMLAGAVGYDALKAAIAEVRAAKK